MRGAFHCRWGIYRGNYRIVIHDVRRRYARLFCDSIYVYIVVKQRNYDYISTVYERKSQLGLNSGHTQRILLFGQYDKLVRLGSNRGRLGLVGCILGVICHLRFGGDIQMTNFSNMQKRN